MRRHWTWILPLTVALTIFWLSSRSQLPMGVSLPHPWDKLAHGTAYLVLAWMLDLALARNLGRLSTPRRLILVLLLTSLFGASDEWHQTFVPGRACELGDWLADTLGGALGLALRSLPLRWRRR
jgi:VanZ family protein